VSQRGRLNQQAAAAAALCWSSCSAELRVERVSDCEHVESPVPL
jgi:hypothetical protein